MPVAGSTRCTGARSHSPRPAAVTPPWLPTAMVRALKPAIGECAEHGIERDAMAADDDKVGHRGALPDQRHARARAGVERRRQRVDLEETVGLREARHRAGALGGRECDRAGFAFGQRHQHELLAAQLGRNAHRHLGLDRARGFRRQPGERADHRRHEGVEGEDRRGRKSRQHRERLAVHDREAERLAGLERDAMHHDAGRAELRDDAMGEIARALRGAAREHDHVAGAKRGAHRKLERDLVVRKRAERHRLAARFRDRGRDDRAVAVVELAPGAACRPAAPARRRSRAPRPSAAAPRRPRRCRRPPACRSRATRCACRAAAPPRRARCRSPHRRRTGRARPRAARRWPASARRPPARCARSSPPHRRRAAPRRRSRWWWRCRA